LSVEYCRTLPSNRECGLSEKNAHKGYAFLRFDLFMMAAQKPLKTAIGVISLAYNQTVISLNTAEGEFLRQCHL
jgi:hypothetical protein